MLIDANQIGYGKTISSVYSVRPRPGAPVSTPLRWEEVSEDLDPLGFTMPVVLERVARHGDLFAPVLEGGQELGPALARLRGRGVKAAAAPARGYRPRAVRERSPTIRRPPVPVRESWTWKRIGVRPTCFGRTSGAVTRPLALATVRWATSFSFALGFGVALAVADLSAFLATEVTW